MSQFSPPQDQDPQWTEPVPTGGGLGLSLEDLVRAHHAVVYRYAFRLAGSTADAEDLTQQTFLVAHQKLHQLREPQRAAGWLFAIARTTYLKSRTRRLPVVGDGDLIEPPVPSREILELDSQELQQVLGELPEELRLTLVMFYFEELSYREIANELEIPIGTVMSRLSRAKQRLRWRLGVEVPPDAAPVCRPPVPATNLPVTSRNTQLSHEPYPSR